MPVFPKRKTDGFAAVFSKTLQDKENTDQVIWNENMKRVLYIIVVLLIPVGCASVPGIDEQNLYLERNSNTPGVSVTDTGLQFEVLRAGLGPKPTQNSKVTLHFIAKNIDGSVLDSTYERGEPPSFILSGVIPGLVEGVQEMEVGSKYRFVVPAELAYGSRGAGKDIKPDSTLIYEVELLNVE